jgi:hypothetical protein
VHDYCREQAKNHFEFSDYRAGDPKTEATWWGWEAYDATEESVLRYRLVPQLLCAVAIDIKHAWEANASALPLEPRTEPC